MYVKLSVSDTGKGISESNQAAIFRRIYREEEVHGEQGVPVSDPRDRNTRQHLIRKCSS